MRSVLPLALAVLALSMPHRVAADPPRTEELTSLDERLSRSPTDLEARLRRAETLVRMGAAADALEDVRLAELLAPADGRTTLLRAWCLLVLGRAEQARAALDDAAIARAPSPAEARALRARIAIALGDERAAREDLDRALETLAEADLYLLRAELDRRLRGDASEGLTEGLLRTGSVVLEAALVEELARVGRAAEALAQLAASALPALRRTLTTARLLRALARDDEALREAALAEREARARIAERPTAARHLELALALSLLARCDEARAHLDAAAGLSPAYASRVHPGLGDVAAAVRGCGGER
jgi:tetratricopeptide (TPR) repeat protein